MKAVITFHSIDSSKSVLAFSPALFEKLLDGLARSNIPVMPLEELLQSATTHGVALTFDDGMRSVYSEALPIIRDRNIKAHLFLATDTVRDGNRGRKKASAFPGFEMLNWDELGKLQDCGFQIDAHTCSHPDLRQLSDQEVVGEFERCDEIITDRLGRTPHYFAYPFGFVDSRLEMLAGRRYRACFTTKLTYLNRSERLSALPRLDSFYLQHGKFAEEIFSTATRSYLRARGILRWGRGLIWNKTHA
ncbi:MAG: polysaccharide deacetylase family protein [Alphaproteobacteria bacterium]|nr:polysaccharide deacetylase family protein [Alphaproteobacteria bacterium]